MSYVQWRCLPLLVVLFLGAASFGNCVDEHEPQKNAHAEVGIDRSPGLIAVTTVVVVVFAAAGLFCGCCPLKRRSPATDKHSLLDNSQTTTYDSTESINARPASGDMAHRPGTIPESDDGASSMMTCSSLRSISTVTGGDLAHQGSACGSGSDSVKNLLILSGSNPGSVLNMPLSASQCIQPGRSPEPNHPQAPPAKRPLLDVQAPATGLSFSPEVSPSVHVVAAPAWETFAADPSPISAASSANQSASPAVSNSRSDVSQPVSATRDSAESVLASSVQRMKERVFDQQLQPEVSVSPVTATAAAATATGPVLGKPATDSTLAPEKETAPTEVIDASASSGFDHVSSASPVEPEAPSVPALDHEQVAEESSLPTPTAGSEPVAATSVPEPMVDDEPAHAPSLPAPNVDAEPADVSTLPEAMVDDEPAEMREITQSTEVSSLPAPVADTQPAEVVEEAAPASSESVTVEEEAKDQPAAEEPRDALPPAVETPPPKGEVKLDRKRSERVKALQGKLASPASPSDSPDTKARKVGKLSAGLKGMAIPMPGMSPSPKKPAAVVAEVEEESSSVKSKAKHLTSVPVMGFGMPPGGLAALKKAKQQQQAEAAGAVDDGSAHDDSVDGSGVFSSPAKSSNMSSRIQSMQGLPLMGMPMPGMLARSQSTRSPSGSGSRGSSAADEGDASSDLSRSSSLSHMTRHRPAGAKARRVPSRRHRQEMAVSASSPMPSDGADDE